MGLILTGIWYMMQAGVRYVRVTNATIEMQEACLTALASMTQEIGESSRWAFRTDGTEVVFASPRDHLGKVRFDGQNRMLWQKVVAYYVETVNDIPCLVRKEELLEKPTSKPPDLPSANSLQGDASLVPRVVARNIESIRAVYGDPTDATVDTQNLVTLTAVAEIVTLDTRRQKGEKDFRMQISTSVVLKN